MAREFAAFVVRAPPHGHIFCEKSEACRLGRNDEHQCEKVRKSFPNLIRVRTYSFKHHIKVRDLANGPARNILVELGIGKHFPKRGCLGGVPCIKREISFCASKHCCKVRHPRNYWCGQRKTARRIKVRSCVPSIAKTNKNCQSLPSQ